MARKELMKYLKSHKLMQLATGTGKPTICTVYYATDGKFNLYFISNPKTRHCTNIRKNSSVACAVTDSDQTVTSRKSGMQIYGTASHLKTEKEIRKSLDLWNNANPGLEKFITFERMKDGRMTDRLYKIKIKEIKFFSEKLYGSEGFRTFRF